MKVEDLGKPFGLVIDQESADGGVMLGDEPGSGILVDEAMIVAHAEETALAEGHVAESPHIRSRRAALRAAGEVDRHDLRDPAVATRPPTLSGMRDLEETRSPTRGLGPSVKRAQGRLGDVVVRDLVTAIVTEVVAPGDVLPPEGSLSERFGVSRTVIRESIKRLDEKGLVTVSQGRGTVVNPPRRWNVLDPDVLSALVDNDESLQVLDELAVVRASLEAAMARAAASRRTDSRAAELRSAFALAEASVDDLDAYNEADAAFHDLVMEQSGNRLAANITRILFARARESTRFVGVTHRDALRMTLEEHRRILEAIGAGDPELAANEMRKHILSSWERRRPARPA